MIESRAVVKYRSVIIHKCESYLFTSIKHTRGRAARRKQKSLKQRVERSKFITKCSVVPLMFTVVYRISITQVARMGHFADCFA
jgi:hypothetical protein